MNTKIKQSKEIISKLPTESISHKMDGEKRIYSSMFEIYGRVQGVYFRKHTQIKAKQLGLNGWCMNTQEGTVKGIMEGPQDMLSEMRLWLQHKGSPRSIIEKAVFTPFEPIPNHNYHTFSIKR
ncbi:PREDICTED: acylphosphatase-2 [Drosophila arizonae]|uniref:Acylphosphatase n=1 Tax=Drosophila arizonae TaxID=7263 RepID=A0ABM1NYU4_DROAR|nr:PREDICTED: acylphosphatase-2 [Drosophila arizonae]